MIAPTRPRPCDCCTAPIARTADDDGAARLDLTGVGGRPVPPGPDTVELLLCPDCYERVWAWLFGRRSLARRGEVPDGN
jgi:hypothetical protein